MGNIQNVTPANAAGAKSVGEIDLNIQIIKPEIKAFMDEFQAELANKIKTEHANLWKAIERSNTNLSVHPSRINNVALKILEEKLKKDTPANNFLKEIFSNPSCNFKNFFVHLVARPLDLKNIIVNKANPNNSKGAFSFLMEVAKNNAVNEILKKYVPAFKESATAAQKGKSTPRAHSGEKKKHVRKTGRKLDKMKRDLGIGSPGADAQTVRVEGKPEAGAPARKPSRAGRAKTRAPRAKVEVPKVQLPKLPPKPPKA